ncbi:hypothetical protein M0812_01536 [Anaeramoeba flamelloides]|uniref:B box-type domain-containing protein n=1 Tax=Anaeramoeba flamelloides TaxID=1746091 RepID=A0AAV7ZRT3_9EUKA|nr:hypothetical protein M0812_01536 [Anaeramoeba flamelloides]
MNHLVKLDLEKSETKRQKKVNKDNKKKNTKDKTAIKIEYCKECKQKKSEFFCCNCGFRICDNCKHQDLQISCQPKNTHNFLRVENNTKNIEKKLKKTLKRNKFEEQVDRIKKEAAGMHPKCFVIYSLKEKTRREKMDAG